MINNFELIAPLLKFDSLDDYYFAQILKRRKDNPGMPSDRQKLCTFNITSLDKFWKMQEDTTRICDATNARAYINLNKKSFRKSTMYMLSELATNISNDNFRNDQLFDSASGSVNAPDASKVWILDIDSHDWYDKNIGELSKVLSKIEPLGTLKIITTIPTKNGCHILTSPFNLKAFSDIKPEWFRSIAIHKNNPTILYCAE